MKNLCGKILETESCVPVAFFSFFIETFFSQFLKRGFRSAAPRKGGRQKRIGALRRFGFAEGDFSPFEFKIKKEEFNYGNFRQYTF